MTALDEAGWHNLDIAKWKWMDATCGFVCICGKSEIILSNDESRTCERCGREYRDSYTVEVREHGGSDDSVD